MVFRFSSELWRCEMTEKSRMAHVADYADFTATEEQLAASYGVVEGLLAVLRAAPLPLFPRHPLRLSQPANQVS
jgi:hypothetical protein